MKCVIIGNSAAAVGCVEAIRQQDADADITLVAREPHHTYARPLISYLLAGKTDEVKMHYRPESFYQAHGVRALLGRTALSIDPDAHAVMLDGNEQLSYDKLLVATGSEPIVPPVEGLTSVKNQSCFLSLDDARQLMALPDGARVLVLGAGLIGLKCAEGLSARNLSVTALDMSQTILPSVLPPDAAGMVEDHIRAQGVKLILGDAAIKFEPGIAYLKSGGTVAFDHLVVAVGVRPNVALLRDAGADIGRGVIVDERGRTNLPDVYAAGDCAEGIDSATGLRRVLALLPNAYHQGAAAGADMTGAAVSVPPAIAMNALPLWGLHILSAGNCDGERYVKRDGTNYRLLCTGGDMLRGFVLIGDVARAGIYTAMIRDHTPVSTVDFERIRDNPGLIAFSRTDRVRKLGGAAS